MSAYAETMAALNARRRQIETLHGEMRDLQAKVEPQEVADAEMDGWDGPVRLSALFGDKRDLILIHNMGTSCSSCTMWADGFNGVYDHLAARAAFVVASPNPVEVQKKFAAGRGWRFPMVSYGASDFAEAMGYRHASDHEFDKRHGGWNPGVSVFRREGGKIFRVSDAEFGPGDGFCVLYSLFDLVPDATLMWSPKFSYA